MDLAALSCGRAVVHRRPDQRVTKPKPYLPVKQAGVDRWRVRVSRYAEGQRRPVEQGLLPRGVGGPDEQENLRGRGQQPDSRNG